MNNFVRHIRKMDFVTPIPLLDQVLSSAVTFIASIICFNNLLTNEIGILSLSLSAIYAVTSILKNNNINSHFLTNRVRFNNPIKSHRKQLSELLAISSILSFLILFICLIFTNNILFAGALSLLVFSLTCADVSRYLIIVFGDQKKSIKSNLLSLILLLSLFLIFSGAKTSHICILVWSFSQIFYTLLVTFTFYREETNQVKLKGSKAVNSRILTWESIISQTLIILSGFFFLTFSPGIYGEIRIAYTLFVAGPYLVLNAFGQKIGFANRNGELNVKGIVNLIVWFSIPIALNSLLFMFLCMNYEFLTGNRWTQISKVIPGVICFILITVVNQVFYFPLASVLSKRSFIFFELQFICYFFYYLQLGFF